MHSVVRIKKMKPKNPNNMRHILMILLVNFMFVAFTVANAYQDTASTQIEFCLGQNEAESDLVEMEFYKSLNFRSCYF
jgi:hypothetical protein